MYSNHSIYPIKCILFYLKIFMHNSIFYWMYFLFNRFLTILDIEILCTLFYWMHCISFYCKYNVFYCYSIEWFVFYFKLIYCIIFSFKCILLYNLYPFTLHYIILYYIILNINIILIILLYYMFKLHYIIWYHIYIIIILYYSI